LQSVEGVLAPRPQQPHHQTGFGSDSDDDEQQKVISNYAAPIMAVPPLILVRLEKTEWLRQRPRMVLPVNLGLILTTSIFALPLALAAFPQRQAVQASSLEEEFHGKGGLGGLVEFNRGI